MVSQSSCSQSSCSRTSSLNLPHSMPRYSAYQSSSTSVPQRIYLRPSTADGDHSPCRRSISFSTWTHFTASGAPSAPGSLKASVLWKASGTKSTYDPPASEWAYLGVEQEIYIGKPPVERRRKTARPSRAEGLSGESKAMAGISFNKQPINKTSTMSQLTKGIELGMLAIPSMAKIYGLEGYKPDDLPSTFDDSDDDDEF
jgi:hypothetical protein